MSCGEIVDHRDYNDKVTAQRIKREVPLSLAGISLNRKSVLRKSLDIHRNQKSSKSWRPLKKQKIGQNSES